MMFFGRVFVLISLGGQAPHVPRWACVVRASYVRGAKQNRVDHSCAHVLVYLYSV